jgi:murein DD-endopeptidase MepM/ murein hydrolase activator NlpD
MRRSALAAACAVALALAACDGQVITTVTPPRTAAPEASVQVPAPAPQAASSAPVATAEEAKASEEAPKVAVAGPLPGPGAPVDVRNAGDAEGALLLQERPLMVPVVGIPPASLMDNYEQKRGQGLHEAIDIVAPTGTPVVAVDDGRIVKLFNSKPGGLTVYHFDPQGRLAYYYAHLASYAPGLKEGMEVKRGDVLGYVGSTGNADPKVPHLHFAIFKLGADKKWWQGDPINPFPALRRGAPAQLVTAAK